jgi:hypothetical protein
MLIILRILVLGAQLRAMVIVLSKYMVLPWQPLQHSPTPREAVLLNF